MMIKAVLCTAFIFPGTGHLVLKRYIEGIAIMVVAIVALVPILNHVFSIALEIAFQITQGEIEPNFLTLREIIAERQAESSTWLIDVAVYVLIGTWLVGIVDTVRMTKTTQNNAVANKEN